MAVHKRWYDHDPLLLEVIEVLRNYQDELREQALVFIEKIESQVSKDALDSFYASISFPNGTRWYDKDPVLSKTVEILRIIPPDIQKKAAQNFLESLKRQGIDPTIISQADS